MIGLRFSYLSSLSPSDEIGLGSVDPARMPLYVGVLIDASNDVGDVSFLLPAARRSTARCLERREGTVCFKSGVSTVDNIC